VLWIAVVIFLIFASVTLRGAPYLNSHKLAVQKGLDLLELKKGQTIIDLGSGTGNVILAAAKREIHGYGYELNPILVFISKFRLRKYPNSKIIWGDYWTKSLPACDGIYIFSMGRFMKKLPSYLSKNAHYSIKVVCYGFEIPQLKSVQQDYGFYVYHFSPVANKPFKP
jgi:16S rRNA A1518/A1519 N6-dimethyltransferase RsmA/KsgA/DIM1 with predicted DNA glycosylase/AP lyase activity